MTAYFGELTPILIIAMIVGLVEFAKKFGVEGSWSLALSLALGAVFGVGFQVAEHVPVTFAEWFAVIVFALLFGLTASGLYDVGKRFAS